MIAEREVIVDAGDASVPAVVNVPAEARGLVVFAHGSGSSRHSPRNKFVARLLQEDRFATVLADLLTATEDEYDRRTAELRFDIELLARRLDGITDWCEGAAELRSLPLGYFGASTGAAAALVAAARRADIRAIVSRGGRPDLAGADLARVKAPTLLIVGSLDYPVIEMNRSAQQKLAAENEMVIVPGAGHLFEEIGALERVAELARDWFEKYLKARE